MTKMYRDGLPPGAGMARTGEFVVAASEIFAMSRRIGHVAGRKVGKEPEEQ